MDNIGNGCIRNEDYLKLIKRTLDKLSYKEQQILTQESTVRLFPTNDIVKEYNESRLARKAIAVAAILSENNPASGRTATSCKANGLEPTLYLCKGCRVMLRNNLWTNKGLANDAPGFFREILYPPESQPPSSTHCHHGEI